MSLSLSDRLRADHQLFQLRASMAIRNGWDLDAKFKIVAAGLRAQPLGFCPLTPEVDYPIVAIRRISKDSRALENFYNTELEYVLPRAYSEMVTDADIFKINSGQMHFVLIRTRKLIGPTRLHYNFNIRYMYDLQLCRYSRAHHFR